MSFVSRDPVTGMRHGGIRWPHGTTPTPFGCRWCGDEQHHHGRQWTPRFEQGHYWVRPTNAQILKRMKARREARLATPKKANVTPELMVTIALDDRPLRDAFAAAQRAIDAVCRCDQPDADPYQCEADDCTYPFSELNPFGGAPVREFDPKVSRKCPRCGWRTTSWHVDDGSAEAELHGHVRVHHGGSYAAALRPDEH